MATTIYHNVQALTPDVGEKKFLDRALQNSSATTESLTIRLYKNNYTPVHTSVASDFTEADFSGYTSGVLGSSTWDYARIDTNPASDTNDKIASTYGTWNLGNLLSWYTFGGETVYGMYATGTSSNVLYFAARFPFHPTTNLAVNLVAYADVDPDGTGISPLEGQAKLLDRALQNSSATTENLVLRLFSNDYTPDLTTTNSNLTEATFGGYGGITLVSANWAAASTVSGKASSTYPSQGFNASSSQTIFGYYLKGSSSGKIYIAERFASSRSVSNGHVLSVTPTITFNAVLDAGGN